MKPFYSVHEIRKNVYHIYTPADVGMDLFVGTEKALLLDTGFGFGDLRKLVEEITDLPLTLVNTHGHYDHTGGNRQFDVPAYLHPADLDLCRRSNSPEKRRRSLENAKRVPDPGTGIPGSILPDDFDEEAYIHAGTGSFLPLGEGMTFDLGGITLRAVEFPGHTAGSVGLFYEEEKILYTGDAMDPFIWMFLPESLQLSQYVRQVRKAIAMKPETVIISHAERLLEPADLDAFLEVAETLDFESCMPFDDPAAEMAGEGADVRVGIRHGYRLEDEGKPGFAAIAIDRAHLG